MEILCSGLDELENVVARIFEFGKENKIWLLKGDIGAGKTTFMHVLAGQLGVVDMVNSPSYSIINEYRTRDEETFYHFDLFRIKSTAEVLEIGFLDYIDSTDYCFIEWPELIENLLPSRYTEVFIQVTGPDVRIFNVNLHA